MACKFIYKGEEYTRDEIVQVVQDNNLYVKGEYNKAKAWLEDKLGLDETSDFELIQGLMEEGSFGRFTSDARILLAEGFEQGSEYHEAFHRVFNIYLSEDQKEALRAEFQTRKDKSKVFTQYKEKYPNLSDNDVIEEILSEEFRDYVLANGKYTFPEKEKQGFFTKLFNFLKAIVDKLANNISTQEAVYKKIQEGGFKKTTPVSYSGKNKDRIISFKVNNKDFKLSEKETQNLMRGALFSLLERLSEQGMSFSDIENSNIDLMEFLFENTYGEPVILDLVKSVRAYLIKNGLPQQESPILNFLAYSSVKPKDFKEALNRYLNAFKIKLISNEDIDAQSNTDEDNEAEHRKGKSSDEYKISVEVDPYTSVSTNIKLLLATIAKKDKNGNYILNDLGLKENEDPQKVFMVLSQNLAGIPATPENFVKVLNSLQDTYPYMNDIIQRVGFNSLDNLGTTEDDLNKLNFINQFIQAFAKTRYFYNITFIDPETGNIYSTDAQIDNSQRKIRSEWQSSFNQDSSKLTTFRTSLKALRAKTDNKDLVKLLKLDLTEEQLKNEVVDKQLDYIKSRLLTFLDPRNEADKKKAIAKNILKEDGSVNYSALLTFISAKNSPFEVSGAFEKIASVIASKGEYVNLQHFNTEGKMVYGISLNSFFTLVTDKANYLLKDAKTKEERKNILQTNFPFLFTNYSANSLIVEALIEGSNVKVGITDGAKNKEDYTGTKTSNLKDPMRLVQVLNDTLQGNYHFMQTGDRTTMNVFNVKKEGVKELFINPDSFGKVISSKTKDDDYFWDNVSNVFLGYLKDEVKNYNNIRSNESDYIYINDNNDKNILRFWKDILTKDEALKLASSPNLDLELQKPIYKTKLKNFLEKEFQKYKGELERAEVLTIQNNKVAGISNELIDEYGSIDNVIMYSMLNQIVANIEQSKVFFGDFAAYKDITDIFKRLSQFNSTRKVSINSKVNNKFIADSNKVNLIELEDDIIQYKPTEELVNEITEVVLKDGETTLSEDDLKGLESLVLESFKKDFSNIKDAERAAKNFVKHYTSFEEADGQSYVNIFFYRAMMLKSGAWEKEDERIFKKIINNEDLKSEEIIRFSIQKPNYLGPVNDSTFLVSNRKTSYFPLIPQLIKGTNLERINNTMLKEGIDVLHLDSASKFGVKGVKGKLAEFYNDNGSLNLTWAAITNTLSWDYLGVQLDMNKKAKNEITEASQARKNLLHNLFDGGVPRDYKGNKSWNELSFKEKIKQSDLARLAYEYNNTMNDYIDESYKSLEKEIGLIKIGKDSYKITNWKSFKEILLKEATDRSSSDVVLQGINLFIEDDGKVNYINALSNKIKIEQILMSIVTNRIVRQKRFGDTLPQGSIKGLETTEHRNKSGKKFYSSDVLKFHQPNGKGGLTLAEFAVPLPDDMIKFVDTLPGNSFEERLKHLNDNINQYLDESVRKFHGLRIPNQQYSSNAAGIIKMYLPPTANTIIVPSAFVTQTGSDFDIDKLFAYFKKYAIDYKNKKIYELKLNDRLVELKKYLDKYSRRTQEEAELDDVYQSDFKEKLAEYRSIKEIDASFTDDKKIGLHNKLIDLSVELLTHPENVRQVLNPVDDKLLNDEDGQGLTQLFLKEMGSVDSSGKAVMPDKKLSITDVFLPLTSHTKFKDFFAGVIGIGQVARHIPNHAFTQLKDLRVNGSTLFNDHDGQIGKVRDVNGNWITEVLSMFLTSQVDIGKNPYARYLGITRRTLNIITYLVRRGADYREVLAFMQQPIIQKYIQFMEINESEFIKNTGRGKLQPDGTIKGGLELKNDDIVLRTLNFLNIDVKNESFKPYFEKGKFNYEKFITDNNFDKHSLNSLLKGLNIYKGDLNLNNPKSLNFNEKVQQLRILGEFLDYTEQSKKFENFIRIANPDTSKEKDLVEVKTVLDDINTVREEGFIVDFDKNWLSDDPFSNLLNAHNNARYVKDAYSNIDYIYNDPYLVESLDQIMNTILPKFSSRDEKEAVKKALISDFISRQIVRYLENKYGINVVNSLKGDKSAAREIKRIKRDKNNPLHDNSFIDSLVTLIDNVELNGKTYDNYQTYDKKATVDRINLLTAEIEEIRKHNLALFEKLYYSNFAQSGIHNSPYQLNQFLPTGNYFNVVKEALNQNLIDQEELNTFFEKFLLNRPGLLQKQSAMDLEISAMNPYFDNTPNIYSIWNKSKGFWDVVVKGIGKLSPIGNGLNVFDYTGSKKTNLQLESSTKQEVIEQPINKEIKPTDRIIWGHPTIGKSFLKEKGNNSFITLDDDYADEVNAFVDANRGLETRQEYKGRKPKEYNEFMLNLFDRLKVQAKKEGKRLFVSNTNILKERMSEFDKVITIPKDEFKKRFDARGATYGFEDWKSDIDATVAKVDKSKVISTTGYLSDLLNQPTEIKPKIDSSKRINIYAGTNENAELSNFAVRPFQSAAITVLQQSLKPGIKNDVSEIVFESVEQAFQFAKLIVASQTKATENSNIVKDIMNTTNGGKLRNLGKAIKGLNIEFWDKQSSSLMKKLLKESFKQNPQALAKLLATGNAELTHTQDKGKWGKEFPKLLMEVRNELQTQEQPIVEETKDDNTKTPIEGLNDRLKAYGDAKLVLSNNFYEGSRPEGRLNAFKSILQQVKDNFQVLGAVKWDEFTFLSEKDKQRLEALKPKVKEFSKLNLTEITINRTVTVEKRYAQLSNEIINEFVSIMGKHVQEQLGKTISSSNTTLDDTPPWDEECN